MGRHQGVNAGRSAHEVNRRVGYRGAQRAGDDAEEIDEHDAPPVMNHLEGNAEDDLDEHVEYDVRPAGVDEHVRQETPRLVATVGVVDKVGFLGDGAHRPDVAL